MANGNGNGWIMKIVMAAVLVFAAAAGWKLYENVQTDIRTLNDKVGQLAIMSNITNTTVTRVDTNVQNLADWAQKSDRNQVRIMIKLGMEGDLGSVCPPESVSFAVAHRYKPFGATGGR